MLFEDPATPAGMLTDEQAAAIRAAGGPAAAPPEYRDFYTAHLNQYDSFRQSHPRVVDLQEMARKDRVLEDLTLDFDKATAGQDLMSLRMAPDEATRAAAKDSLVVDTYIRGKTGRGFNGATRAKMRDAVATTLFGEGKGLGSDSAFVAEARKYQTKGRETRIQAEGFASAGAWDALKLEPGDSMADLARIQESAKAVQGMTPEDADRFVGTYQRMREETEARAAPHRPLARAVRELLEVQAAKKYTGDGGDEDFGLALDLMLSLPDEAVPLVFSMIRGKKAPDDKPGVQKGAENIERGFISRLRTFAEPTLRGRLMDLGRTLEAGAPLTIRDGDSVEQAVLRRVGETTLPMAEAGQAGVEGQAFHDYFNSRTATPAENKQAAETVRKMLARNIMAGRLVNLSEQTVDPATSSDSMARSLYGAAYSIGAMAPVFIPYAGLVIAQGSYANDEFHRLIEMGVDAETANFNSQITGGIQAGLERLGVRALTAGYSNLAMRAGSSRVGTAIGNVLYKFPGLNRAAPGVLPLNAAGRIVGGLGLTQTGEYLEEVAQDATPIFTAALAERMGMTLPEQASMEAEVKRFKFWNPEMYLSLLPITGAMGGFRSLQNNSDAVRQRDALLADPVAMRAAGAAPELAERVAALSAGERAEAWRAEAPRLDPSTETAGEAQETLMGRQTLAARRSVEEQQAAGIAAIRRTDSGWQVERMDEVTVSVSSAEAAESMVRDLAQASTLREAEALVSIADQWHSEGVPQEGRQTTFTGALTLGTGEGIFRQRNGEMVQEVTDEETLRNLREEAMMDGATDVNVIINGSNRAFTETVADGALRVVQALEVNQTVSSVVTLLHEQSERNLRRLLDSGSVTETDMVSALNFAAIALPESAVPESDAAGKAFRQRVTRGAMGELSMGEMRETVVELAVADTLGRRKDGGRFEAGAITRALTASIQSAGSAAELKGIQRFLAMLKAVRAYLRGVMGTVAGLRKARRDGKLAEGNTLDALIDRITGRDQQKAHNEAVAEEVAREQREESPAAPEVWGRWAAAQPPLSQAEKRAIGALTPKLRAAYDSLVQRNGGSRTVGLTALGAESGIPEEDMQRWVLEYGINQGMAVLALDGIRLNDSAGQSPADGAASFSVSSRAQPVEPDAPVRNYGNAAVVGPTTFSISAYHGTPHRVREFSTKNIGTGEGAQVYGWGLYFAQDRKVAEWYRETLSERVTTADGQPYNSSDPRHEAGDFVARFDGADGALKTLRERIARLEVSAREEGEEMGWYRRKINGLQEVVRLIEAGDYAEVKEGAGGSLYTVELGVEDSQLLDWDSGRHSDEAKAALAAAWQAAGFNAAPDGYTAQDAVRDLTAKLGSPRAASEHLLAHGVRGIKYLDGNSRNNQASRDFLASFQQLGLPYDASPEAVMAEVESDGFGTAEGMLLRMLEANDWLGFDHPAQAVSAALSGYVRDYDASADLISFAEEWRGPEMWNYVVFQDSDIRITAENGQARSQASSVTFSLGRNPEQRVPVVAVPDTKLKGGSIREIRKDATVYAAEHGVYGRHLNDDTGWEIAVTSDSLTHAFTHMGPQQIHSVPSLPDLIRSAVHVATERHRDNNRGFTEVHRMRAAMEFRGGLYSVKLSVKEHREQGRSLYDLKAVEIKREPGGNVLPISSTEAETSGPAPGSTVSLAEIAPEVNQSPDAGASFSLSSVSALEAVAAKLEARMAAGGPEAKLAVLGDIARTVAGMARAARYNEETENVIAAGRIEERRRALRQELLERYTLEVLESPVGMALLNDEAVSVRDLTVTGQVLDLSRKGLHGVFLAPSKAKKAGMRLAGEYDDAAGLPGWMFHGERTPDQVAASLGMDVAEMWATIHDELASMKRMREYQISAREQMAEARVRAGTEAAEWASQQRAKLAVSDARDARRALVTLDAMIAKLPAEVRRSVGGFTPVADLKTNKAREEYFLRTVDKIDKALERHLRREYQERTRVLFRKAAVKAKPGQGDWGGLTVNGHTWFQHAEAITRMSERELAEREAWVRLRLTGVEELTAGDVTELNRMWDFGGGVDGATLALEQEDALLNLFGGFSHTEADGSPARSALELETAMKAAQEQLTAGRTKWEEAITERRMWRVTRRLQLQNDSKTTGLPDAIAARKKALEGWDGDAQEFFQKGFSWEQLVGDIFGRGSVTHQFAERTALHANTKAKADWMNRQLQFQDFLKTLWPRSGSLARQVQLEKLATRHNVPNAPQGLPEMSELEAVHYTMLWADQDSRDWLVKWNFGDDAQAAMEAWLSPAARSIRTWLQERYDAQYDEINEVYRRIHGVNMPRVANYAPRIVEHGQATTTMDPLNPTSPEGLGVFAGFTKRRRPQIASMPIQTDALSAYWMNQRVTGHWRAWAEPMRELRAVFSNPETAPYIKAAAGDKAASMVNLWLTDMEQGGRREVMSIETLRRWISANADNALFGKLGVLGKQIPASYGSAAEIGWSNWLASVRRIAAGKASITLTDIYNSQVMRQRRWADLPETLQSARGTGTHPFARALRKVGVEIHAIDMAADWMRQRLGWTDAFFTTLSAAAAYDSHYREAIASGSTDAEARALAEELTTITVSRTAQPDALVNKSIFENGLGTWGRLFFAFQSANRQALFMTAAAFRDGGKKSGEAWRKAVTHWVLTGLVTQTVGSLARDWLSDDDDDDIWSWGAYGRAMLLGPLTGALYFGPFVDLAGGLLGGFERRSAPGPAGAVGDGVRTVIKIATDEDTSFDIRSADKVARALGFALSTKIPRASGLNIVANVFKQVEGAADNAWETEAEVIEGKAKKQREAEKEKRKAEADKLPEDEKERRKQEKKAQKEARLKADAEAWDREHPEGE